MLKLRDVKGVGEKTEKLLNELGINDVFELFSFFPSKYIDLNNEIKIKDAEIGQYSLFNCKVERISSFNKVKNYFYIIFSDNLDNNNFKIKVNFFNKNYLYENFKIGDNYKFVTKINDKKFIINNPIIEGDNQIPRLNGIFTVYPLKNIIGQNVFKNIISNAFLQLEKVGFEGNFSHIYKYFLLLFNKIHKPNSLNETNYYLSELAKIDIAICLSVYQKTINSNKNYRKVLYKMPFSIIDERFTGDLPYSLSKSQMSSINDIKTDLLSNNNMSRIVSGDVGSGKTIIAIYLCVVAAANGFQSIFMAPTEILAKQHFDFINKYFLNLLNPVLLTSSISSFERKIILEKIRFGEYNCIIGTQSVFSSDVEYKSLCCAIIDEQHKFGVSDRNKLEIKGAKDILSLTATPIPRSIALTFYNNISISHIERRNDVKFNIKTYIIKDLKQVMDLLIKKAIGGKKIFIVCPAIYDNDGNEFYSIEKFLLEFKNILSQVKFSIIHSKFNIEERNNIMNGFVNNDINLLISTSLIEVGIDSSASEILILNADRFGLASLHQLRGRVGRLGQESNCYLHCGSTNAKCIERLNIVKNNINGDLISEYDFNNRGPGEFIGLNQSGYFKSPLFGLNINSSILFNAKEYAEKELSCFSLNQLKILTRKSSIVFDEFIEKIKNVTLNS